MKSFQQKINELAEKYEDEWHKQNPNGCTVADYCNREVPGDGFLAGAESAVEVLKNTKKETGCDATCFNYSDKDTVADLQKAEARIAELEKDLSRHADCEGAEYRYIEKITALEQQNELLTEKLHAAKSDFRGLRYCCNKEGRDIISKALSRTSEGEKNGF